MFFKLLPHDKIIKTVAINLIQPEKTYAEIPLYFKFDCHLHSFYGDHDSDGLTLTMLVYDSWY